MRILIQDRYDNQIDHYKAEIAPVVGDRIRITTAGKSEFYKIVERQFSLNNAEVAGILEQEVHLLLVVEKSYPDRHHR